MKPKKAAAPVKAARSINPDESKDVRCQKITNGYLVHESTCDAKGNYKTSTTYHKAKPKISVTINPK